MKVTLYPSDERGKADYGWLKARHSFSFGNYYHPSKVHFGALRVLNDDQIAPGMGFGTHPHDNMEIITIPLEGAVEHKDSLGSHGLIHVGEVQVMSAGTGINHSEYNASKTDYLKLLQIWIIPNLRDVTPRYAQANFSTLINRWTSLVGPENSNALLWIHQQAYISITEVAASKQIKYALNHPENGVYLFVIEGNAQIENQYLHLRDAAGISDTGEINILNSSDTTLKILALEVPMEF
jgi:redox-sensitive bicupin YhaK (pirin superfamily)